MIPVSLKDHGFSLNLQRISRSGVGHVGQVREPGRLAGLQGSVWGGVSLPVFLTRASGEGRERTLARWRFDGRAADSLPDFTNPTHLVDICQGQHEGDGVIGVLAGVAPAYGLPRRLAVLSSYSRLPTPDSRCTPCAPLWSGAFPARGSVHRDNPRGHAHVSDVYNSTAPLPMRNAVRAAGR